MKERAKPTKTQKLKARNEKVEHGSGNVFADLAFEDAEERLLNRN